MNETIYDTLGNEVVHRELDANQNIVQQERFEPRTAKCQVDGEVVGMTGRSTTYLPTPPRLRGARSRLVWRPSDHHDPQQPDQSWTRSWNLDRRLAVVVRTPYEDAP